jgi:hypothetical protein
MSRNGSGYCSVADFGARFVESCSFIFRELILKETYFENEIPFLVH